MYQFSVLETLTFWTNWKVYRYWYLARIYREWTNTNIFGPVQYEFCSIDKKANYVYQWILRRYVNCRFLDAKTCYLLYQCDCLPNSTNAKFRKKRVNILKVVLRKCVRDHANKDVFHNTYLFTTIYMIKHLYIGFTLTKILKSFYLRWLPSWIFIDIAHLFP